ncbi:uncharacterized protein LOC141526572 [Cotesia typhae]|uniref:uncharacterized protein LOC141526572 n=1 Tax=Cotesia typhae TaxID=2053667 RepID=UPI003D68DC84
MDPKDIINSFTRDEEIEHWVVGDDTIELRGYVDEIVGMRDVAIGRAFDERVIMLLKIIVNNGGNRRICVLFWGERAIQYSEILTNRSIVTIDRAKGNERNSRFNNLNDGLGLIELSLTVASTIQVENFLF